MSRLTRSVSATSVVIGRAATIENAPSATSTSRNIAAELGERPPVGAAVLRQLQHALGVGGRHDVAVAAPRAAPQDTSTARVAATTPAEHQRHPDED